jgi:hypothetical protein
VEMALRSGLHCGGAAALRELLRFPPPDPAATCPCSCGHTAAYRGRRSKSLLTVLGRTRIERPYFLCAHCQQGQFPADGELDVAGVQHSPGVRRMLALVGQEAPFDHGRQQMKVLADLEVTTKAVERTAEASGEDLAAREQQQIAQAHQWPLPLPSGESIPILYVEMDATAIPVVKKETVGRAGKDPGKPARTRDGKLGCVFTQTKTDAQGYPIRDPDSTTYVGAIETAAEFGRRIYAEACRRGWYRALKKVVLGDGAEWIWALVELLFPGAIQIVDLFHAREHLWDLVRQLFPGDSLAQAPWMLQHQGWLDDGLIEPLTAALRQAALQHPGCAEDLLREANYFQTHAERMRYPAFRRQGLFVGSGVIEAGCKTVIGARFKQSGMFWTVRGANAILALRCAQFNGRLEDYWDSRAAA